jgi:hypothetical protein
MTGVNKDFCFRETKWAVPSRYKWRIVFASLYMCALYVCMCFHVFTCVNAHISIIQLNYTILISFIGQK